MAWPGSIATGVPTRWCSTMATGSQHAQLSYLPGHSTTNCEFPISRSLRGKESTTARLIWSLSCANKKLSSWLVEEILPDKQQCSSHRPQARYTCWCGQVSCQTQCHAT